MHRILKTALALLLVLAAWQLLPSLSAAQEDDAARKEGILANLKLTYPQLEKMNVTMGTLAPSEFEGLDVGSFTVASGAQSQTQRFFVTKDNKRLYLIR